MTREITIKPVLNGWVCQVGCQQVVFNDKKQMLAELSAYLDNPNEVEHRFVKNAVNQTMDVPQIARPVPTMQDCAIQAGQVEVDPRPINR